MKKGNIVIISIVALVAIVIIWGIGINNSLVKSDESVKEAWSQVENVYKRRADLVKQLVKVVEGAAKYEKGVLTEVTNARAGVQQTQVDPSQLSEEQIAAYQKAQDNLTKALANTIKVTVERYPELTATQGFRDLQAQLEGTENRITTERGKFNKAVQEYNTKVRRFHNSIIAGICGFDKKGYFTAPQEAEEPTDIEFNI